MGAEQTNYASRTSEIAQTISSSGFAAKSSRNNKSFQKSFKRIWEGREFLEGEEE